MDSLSHFVNVLRLRLLLLILLLARLLLGNPRDIDPRIVLPLVQASLNRILETLRKLDRFWLWLFLLAKKVHFYIDWLIILEINIKF